MADVKFTVEGKGKNLKKTAKEADDLGKATERAGKGFDGAGKAQDRYHRGAKGAAGATSNSTKAFSKMQQSIGGSSGLVGAYATLAANIFAASAAFHALRQAAQLDSVIAALESVGASAGRNLGAASERLREVTNNAISAEMALRTMALGVSSGFSTEQMEGLTKVARGASIALGRDMGDALDRLTRGTAKLEPEILDELGIMVRLDDATAEYASTIGKSVNDLSQYERRQAFLNATLEQGEKKFGELATSVEVNQYDQLAATLNDLSKSFLGIINEGIKPLIELMAKNQGVLVGTLVMFGSTIAKQLLPAMTTLGSKTVEQAKLDRTVNTEKLKNLKITKSLPAEMTRAFKSMQKGTISQNEFNQALRSSSSSIRRYTLNQKNMTISNFETAKSWTVSVLKMHEVNRARQGLIRTMQVHMTIAARENAGNAVQLIGQGNLIRGFAALGRSISLYTKQTMLATKAGNGLTRAMGFIKIGAFGLGVALRGVGSAVMAMLGPIGLIVSVGMMVYEMFKDKFVQADPVKEEADKIIKELDNIEAVAAKFQDKLDKSGANSADSIVAGYKALGGVLQEIQGGLSRVQGAHVKTQRTAVAAAEAEIAAARLVIKENQGKKLRGGKGNTLTRAGRENKEAEDTIEEMTNKANEAREKMEKLAPDELNRVLDEANKKLTNSGAFGEFAVHGTAALAAVKKEIATAGSDMTKVNGILNEAIRPVMNLSSAFEGARDAASLFRKEQTKLAVKAKTPFDGVIEGAQGMLKQLHQVENAIADMEKSGGDAKALQSQRETLMAEIQDQMGVESLTGTGDLAAYVDQLLDARNTLLEHNGEMKKIQNSQKVLNKLDKEGRSAGTIKALMANEKKLIEQKIEGANAVIELNTLALGIEQENQLSAAKAQLALMESYEIEGKEKQTLLNDIERMEEKIATAKLASTQAQGKLDAANAELRFHNATEQLRLTVRENEELIKTAKHEQEIAKLTADRTKQVQALVKARTEATLLAQPGATGEESLSKGQEFVNAQATQKIREDGLKEEHRLRNLMIDLEFQLLDAKTQLFQAELIAKHAEGDINDVAYSASFAASANALNNAREIAKMQKANSDRQLLVDQAVMKNEDKKLELLAKTESRTIGQDADNANDALQAIIDYRKGLVEASAASKSAIKDDIIAEFANETGAEALGDGVYKFTQLHFEELKKRITEALGDKGAAAGAMDTAGASAVSLGITEGITGDAPGENKGLEGFKDKLAASSAVLTPMIEQFKSMGPNGEVVAAVTAGALAIGEAYSSMATTMESETATAGEKSAAKLQAVGAIISNVGNMMAAASRAKIAGLDQEIAKEKQRDGKSKESLAKIAALEKKKEKEKRKAFERDKKMKMASVVIDTAAGIMKTIGQTGFFGIPMAIMIGAMGAAQLAMIAGTSYQGGGGSVSKPSAPSKVTMGDRQNKVDVATGSGRAAGELAYMRGARGQGTSASTFTPSFTGRYRAAGGAAYIVGEQGPEVFVPEVPGRIVPNDEVRTGTATPINATFNINAIDAANMEETLTTQRGNIISMIREAAHGSGEGFLENVDTLALGEDRSTY